MKGNTTIDKTEALERLFQSFKNGLNVSRSEKPRLFLESVGLDKNQINVGFNSGQFHHRTSKEFKIPYIELGVLVKSDAPVNDPTRTPYTTFGRYGVVFPLNNKQGKITNLYSYRFEMAVPKGEFLNESGLYPSFPKPLTKRLFIVPTIIDGASIIQSGILENREAVISLFENEWKPQHFEAIRGLDCLQEIVLINCSLERNENQLPEGIEITSIDINGGVNECLRLNTAQGLLLLINEQIKEKRLEKRELGERIQNEKQRTPNTNDWGLKEEESNFLATTSNLEIISDEEFVYKGKELEYRMFGVIPSNPTLLVMRFEIRCAVSEDVLETTLNLLDIQEVQKQLFDFSETRQVNYGQCLEDLNHIREEFQLLRRIKLQNEQLPIRGYNANTQQKAKELLKEKTLFESLDQLLEESGIIGEKQNRLLLFIIACSYKFKYNLHAVIQADQIEMASELVLQIADCISEKEQYCIDITTSRSFRYYGNSVIDNKLLVIPDYGGITANNGINDLKKLQSKGAIINDAPRKNSNGLLHTVKQEVKSHASSIGACENTKRYFENEPKTIVVGMDTSPQKTQELMEYDCRKMAGMIDYIKENKAKELLEYVTRNLHPMEVINPFAQKLMLPVEIPQARTLTIQLLNFVSLVTLFHQYQREVQEQETATNHTPKIVATMEDVQTAIDLFLGAILVNIDELDTNTRLFFEALKQLNIKSSKNQKATFSSLEIRQALNLSKTTTNRYLKTLVEYEYIKKIGFKNTGFRYQIVNWNNLNELKELLESRFKSKDHGESVNQA